MIYFDVTKAARSDHLSGLQRVSARLRAALGAAATEVTWDEGLWDHRKLERVKPTPTDWLVTAEVFGEDERPGFGAFVRSRSIRTAAIFHDAIPLKFPHITWPHSVARHAGYMKFLAAFDRVWAVSDASRVELAGFWRWQGVAPAPRVEVLALGADFSGGPRILPRPADTPARPGFVAVGILEPRKNQSLLLEVCAELWTEGRVFDLHLVGRANPHFGGPIVERIEAMREKFPGLHRHDAAGDDELARLYAGVRASVFPTLAEGCGLPLLESLWQGVPCVCSDLPVLRENAAGGGCLPVAVNDRAAWKDALLRMLTDEPLHERLCREVASRALPTWSAAAARLRAGLG